MGFKCGILGLSNVGKSTLFNALTATAAAQASNYPFSTIEPNVGEVMVPDPRLDVLAKLAKSALIKPTRLTFVDIAGLVAGASKGEGLGNQFLAHIREVDAIAHVVRCFENDDVVHVSGKINPLSDIDVINTELALADLDTVERTYQRATKGSKAGDKDAIARRDLLERLRKQLDSGLPARAVSLSDAERVMIKEYHLLTSKPVMYVANFSENGFENNPHLEAVRKRAEEERAVVVPVCASIEAEIAQLDAADRKDFLDELGLEEPGLDRVIRGAYRLLGLQTFFPAGQ